MRVAAAVLEANLDFKGSCACPVTLWDGSQPGDIDVLYTGELEDAIAAMRGALTAAALVVTRTWGDACKDKICYFEVVDQLRRDDTTFVIELISPSLHKNAPQLSTVQSFVVSGGAAPSLQVMLPAGRAENIDDEVAAIAEDLKRRTFHLYRTPHSLGDARSVMKLVDKKKYLPADDKAGFYVEWARGRVARADSEIDADLFFTCSGAAPEAVRALVRRGELRYEALGDADKPRARGLLAGFGVACTLEGALTRFSDGQLEAPQFGSPSRVPSAGLSASRHTVGDAQARPAARRLRQPARLLRCHPRLPGADERGGRRQRQPGLVHRRGVDPGFGSEARAFSGGGAGP